MKKYLLILGMITCVLGLTACGSKEVDTTEVKESVITEEYMMQQADMLVASIEQIVEADQVDMVVAQSPKDESIFTSWQDAMEVIGGYNETLGYEVTINEEDVQVIVTISGTETLDDGTPREATVDIIFGRDALTDELTLSSVTTSAIMTTGEMMTNAALNTLLGMGTVFVILILISLIISCFAFIPKIQAVFSKKDKKEESKANSVDNTIAQIIESEELADDTELVAVIAAAIAASEGATSTDGFVVRSIKRSNTKKWQRA